MKNMFKAIYISLFGMILAANIHSVSATHSGSGAWFDSITPIATILFVGIYVAGKITKKI